jgi:hypothetical protein
VTAAALVLVPAVAEDGHPIAMWADDEGAPLAYMTRARVDALVEATRGLIEAAAANLIELRRGNAHLVAGFDTWHDAVADWFGDLSVWRLVRDTGQRVAERQALVASLTLDGHTVREQRDLLGASLGIVHKDQRRLGLVPDKPHPLIDADPEPEADPFRGLPPIAEALARVAAQDDRGLTSVELQAEWDRPVGTATGSLSRLDRRGLIELGELAEARANRRPYRITAAGRVKLAEVIAARDAAEQHVP